MDKAKHFHFIGICGTAMGSTALALRKQGHIITGSDNAVYPPMSTLLEDNGVILMKGYRAENLPADADVYVVGNAISRGNAEVEELLERKAPLESMAGLLKRYVIQGKRSLYSAGSRRDTTGVSPWRFTK